MNSTKICVYCAIEYPETTQYFYKHDNGLTPRCKRCHSKGRQSRRVAPEGKKWCNGCKAFFDFSYFYVVESRRDKLSPVCKKCSNARTKDNYRKRKDSLKVAPEYMVCIDCKIEYSTAEGNFRVHPGMPHDLSNRCKKCEAAHHKASYVPTTKMRENVIMRRRTVEGRIQMIVSLENRRAKKFGIPGRGVTRTQLEEQYYMQGKQCAYCSKELHTTFELDHVLSVKCGGIHDIENVVLTCRFCNRSKGSKLLCNWIIQ